MQIFGETVVVVVFLTAPLLISLQVSFQRKSPCSIKNPKFQNQSDGNEESDVSHLVFVKQSPLGTTERAQTFCFVYFASLITTLQHQQKTVTKVRMYIFAFCLKHGDVYYVLFLFQWLNSKVHYSHCCLLFFET